MDSHVRAVVRALNGGSCGCQLQLHPLQQGIRAGHVPQRPPAHKAGPGGVQRVLGALRIGAGQSARPQQHAAEIPRHHAADVGDLLPLKNVQHGLASRALRLSVVGVAHGAALPQEVAPAVVPRVVIPLFHLLDAGAGLLLRLHPPDVADEAGALFHKLALRGLKGYAISVHPVPSLLCFLLRAHVGGHLPQHPGRADGGHLDGVRVLHLFHLCLPVQGVQQPAPVIGQADRHPPRALVQPPVDELKKLRHALARPGGDGHHVLAPGQDLAAGAVALVEHLDPGQAAGAKLGDQVVHHLRLLLPVGIGHVDDVEQEVGVFQLLQRGLERLHQLVGQLADKAHRVAEHHVQRVADGEQAAGGVQRVEQAVVGRDGRAGEPVEQGGLARVGIAHDGHHGDLVFPALLALGPPDPAHVLKVRPQLVDLFVDEPTGNLDKKSGEEVLTLLKYAADELGVTLILVTHDLHVAEQADRILTIEDGKIVRDSRSEVV